MEKEDLLAGSPLLITSRREAWVGAGRSLASPLPFLASMEQTTGKSLLSAAAASQD